VNISRKRSAAALLVSLFVLVLTTFTLQSPVHAAAAGTPGYFSGKVINQATGKPVKGATVKVFRINTDDLLGQAKSTKTGTFRINGLTAADEELDVRVNGRAIHYETGWVGCGHYVVQSWPAACSFGQGRQTPFKLQRL
jgi:hypothetical protein